MNCQTCGVPDGIWHQRDPSGGWRSADGPMLGSTDGWSMSAPSCVTRYGYATVCQCCHRRALEEAKKKGKKK